jgi:hypothetical protein
LSGNQKNSGMNYFVVFEEIAFIGVEEKVLLHEGKPGESVTQS